ncbi:hypothetical protein GGR76_003520 [Xanthomonas translucens]|nr:hypothetical protein [Xanthomonas campestris]
MTLRSLIGNAPSRTSALLQVRRSQRQVHRSRGSCDACASRPLVRPLGRSGQRAAAQQAAEVGKSVGTSGFGVLELHPLERCKTPTCSASACSNQRRTGLDAPTHQKPAARRSALARDEAFPVTLRSLIGNAPSRTNALLRCMAPLSMAPVSAARACRRCAAIRGIVLATHDFTAHTAAARTVEQPRKIPQIHKLSTIGYKLFSRWRQTRT